MFYINICVKYELICKQYSCCSETCKMLTQKRKAYSSETLQSAVESVIKGETLLQASKTFGVPRTTLADKVGGRHPGAYGGRTTLSEEDEEALFQYVLYMASIGHPLTVGDVK